MVIPYATCVWVLAQPCASSYRHRFTTPWPDLLRPPANHVMQGQDSGEMFHRDHDFFNVDQTIHCLAPHARHSCYELGMEELSSVNIACFLITVKQNHFTNNRELQVCPRACHRLHLPLSWGFGFTTEDFKGHLKALRASTKSMDQSWNDHQWR